MHAPTCPCPACKLIRWQAQKYKNQFYVDPSLPVEQLTSCPMFDAFGFCPHGIVCFLPHDPAKAPPSRDVDTIIKDVELLDREHDAARAQCRVCGGIAINHFGFDRVLPTAMCEACCQTLYCPLIPELAEAVFAKNMEDYQAYKTEADDVRARIPNSFRIAFTKEAHRIGCSKFAWSLVGDDAIVASLQEAFAINPKIDHLFSVGASSGYVEYRYKMAAKRLNLPLNIEAYDEIPNPRFDVAVEAGGPEQAKRRPRENGLLLLCWPPFGSQEKDLSTMGYDTLTYFLEGGGNTVVYIGDESSTGDFRFHARLAQRFQPTTTYRVRHELRRWVPQDMGMVFAGQDSIGVYVKRPQLARPPPYDDPSLQQQQQQQPVPQPGQQQ